jgi:hypothetical protein
MPSMNRRWWWFEGKEEEKKKEKEERGARVCMSMCRERKRSIGSATNQKKRRV